MKSCKMLNPKYQKTKKHMEDKTGTNAKKTNKENNKIINATTIKLNVAVLKNIKIVCTRLGSKSKIQMSVDKRNPL